MKPEELQIGDWIQTDNTPFKVMGFDTSHGEVQSDDWIIKLECCNPIPLTPEILEKNGFKKDEKREEMYYWNWGIGKDCVSYEEETGLVCIFRVFGHLVFTLPLSYVHELQHALKLCGIEKEIIL